MAMKNMSKGDILTTMKLKMNIDNIKVTTKKKSTLMCETRVTKLQKLAVNTYIYKRNIKNQEILNFKKSQISLSVIILVEFTDISDWT